MNISSPDHDSPRPHPCLDLFALLHLPWWLLSGEHQGYALAASFFTLFLYGIIFSVAVQATRSIWSALIPHWVNNLILISMNP